MGTYGLTTNKFNSAAASAIDVTLNNNQQTKYTLTAQWFKDGREVVRKKDVELQPGQETRIAFGDSDSATNGTELNSNPVTPIPAPNGQPQQPIR